MRQLRQRIEKLWPADHLPLRPTLAIAGLLLIFGIIVDMVQEGSSTTFDRSVMLAFRKAGDLSEPIGPAWVQEMARDATALGSFAVLGIILAAVVGYLLLTRRRAAAWLVLAAVLGGVALNSLLKLGFARPRPDFLVPAAKVFTASFPSGHAALSAIAYLTLAALLARTTRSHRLRAYFMAIGIALTFLVGMSRVYLGVHYPTDVLAGWCIGAAWALGCWAVMIQLQRRHKVEPPQADQG
jgi:undecaprenyl-diphosphatase